MSEAAGPRTQKSLAQTAREQALAVGSMVGRLARLEVRLAQRLAHDTAQATGRGLAVVGTGAALGAFACGTLGVAAGLALTGRSPWRPALAGLSCGTLAAGLTLWGLRLLPTWAPSEARDFVRAQLAALKRRRPAATGGLASTPA